MRVNPFYISNLVTALDQTQSTQQQLTQQLSSGVRVNSLSDDPVAAGSNVLLLNQIQKDDSFSLSSSLVSGQLKIADTALGSVVSQLTQAISLATSGNNGSLNDSQRQAIAQQLAGIRDEIQSLANSAYQGQYIFAGGQSGTAPFATDESTSPATTTYNGDTNVNYLQTPNGQTIQLNIPGSQIFTAGGTNDVFAALNNLINDFTSGLSVTASAGDLTSLNTALNYVSQQRVVLDNSLTRLTAATDAVSSEKMQLTVDQTNLMQADFASVATHLSLASTQQSALESVIAQLGSQSLFQKL
ncbi:MAG TPA: flagellar hook-associated protein FlgL [Terracidiphilus sp.]